MWRRLYACAPGFRMMICMHGAHKQQPVLKNRPRNARGESGFTLIEILIVIAVVGLLAGIAYPSYQNIVIKNNRAVARAALVDIVARQEAYYAQTKRYAGNLSDLGFPTDTVYLRSNGGLAKNDSVPSDSIYLLRVQASNNRGFTIEADPAPGILQRKDTECGKLRVDGLGNQLPAACF